MSVDTIPKFHDKDSLSEAIEASHAELLETIGPGADIDKEILISLSRNHKAFLHWIDANLKGAKGESSNYIAIDNAYSALSLDSEDDVFDTFEESYEEIVTILCGFTDEVLFKEGLYPWLEGHDLAYYFIRATIKPYSLAIVSSRA